MRRKLWTKHRRGVDDMKRPVSTKRSVDEMPFDELTDTGTNLSLTSLLIFLITFVEDLSLLPDVPFVGVTCRARLTGTADNTVFSLPRSCT